jgi:cellulose synthase/poly-beta-1,6-N-acetylglucosamine synthase-like glycosyltransferase
MDWVTMFAALIQAMGWFFIGYSLLINTSFLLLTVFAVSDFIGYRRRIEFAAYDESFGEPLARGITVLMPAYNESETIIESVQAMMAMRYPDFEVIVVDDGSKDDTVAKLVAEFDLVEVPLVVDRLVPMKGEVLATYLARKGSHTLVPVTKSNGGKADALNVGINMARKELVCMVDADSILDPDSLLHVSRPFADQPDQVVAAGGVIRIANGSTVTQGRVTDVRMPRTWLSRVQVVEYLRAFMIGRAGWSATGGLLIISGAFGIFRKDVLATVGGMATDCIGEDAELVVRIYKWLGREQIDGKVVCVSEPVAWTEAPETRAVLRRPRRRWHRGLAEILGRHRDMLFRRRYGVIGMLTMPWFVMFELLAPFLEIFGLAYFLVVLVLLVGENMGWLPWDLVDAWFVLLLLAASILYSFLLTMVALLAEEMSYRRYRGVGDLLRAVWAAVEENFGYRQLNAWWRMGGAVEALRKSQHEWGDMQRKGFGNQS